jgi:DNA repair protein SbcD/Mre11
MRILHTSDWHLGRIFHGVHLTEDQADILNKLLYLIKDSKPDVILIAGDLFDRSVPPVEAVNLLDEVVSKIVLDLKIPTIMIAGNHDSPDRIHFGSRLMEASRLRVFGKFSKDLNPIAIEDSFGAINFYPLPYVEPMAIREEFNDNNVHTHDDAMFKIMSNIKNSIDKTKRNVLIAHTFAAGGESSESERPLSIGGSGVVNSAHFSDFDYVALGHLHRPQRAGSDKIMYSGSLMKYSFSEVDQKKYIPIIDMDEKGNISVENIVLNPRRDLRCVEGYIDDILKGPQNGESKNDYIMVTLKDEGAILDAMGKIRSVYPNCLHIERPQLTPSGNLCGPDSNFKKMSIEDLFSSFYKQMTDSEMSEEQALALENILSKYNKMLRGE